MQKALELFLDFADSVFGPRPLLQRVQAATPSIYSQTTIELTLEQIVDIEQADAKARAREAL